MWSQYDLESRFPVDYSSSRAQFLGLAAKYGASARTYVAPGTGPAGEALATDTVWFGSTDAVAVMVLTCATHGVEGFCGAGCQADFLLEGGPAVLPDNTAVLIVHAVNPYGFAWLRRVTQEGVDLNRNGIDFSAPPTNPGYDRYRDAFRPRRPGSREATEGEKVLEAFKAEAGAEAYAVARLSGQYVDPHGIHYGGAGPSWSRLTMEKWIADYALRQRRQVAVIDYHTGLGPYGYGEPICGNRPTEPGSLRGRAWYGESLTEPMRGTSTSVVIPGLVQYIWLRELGPDPLTFIALEYGTFPRFVMEDAVNDEHWLHADSGMSLDSPEAMAIKARFRRAYYPDTRSWKEMVIFRRRQIICQTLAGVSAAAK